MPSAKRPNIISINRPPSLDRVMRWIGRYGRHQHFDEPMTGEEAHKAAAVFAAAEHAFRRDLLGSSWHGNRHIAAKCGEYFQRIVAEPAYLNSNYRPEVDINFGSTAPRQSQVSRLSP